ncbi:MauE/DoxX family redox-associated membrane protein [Mucilaginibacter kameinonensis]|uniref:MauE/DoxX family redox-associated membrane protein n=1 Tax=Mucilaginibacter kameinonensis TaxID=452286 RepID=UPI000EF81133|nr:MauE/DoxX family redox-associated membrane protein [Mucilaginibacter kameinonensis]
MITPHIRNPHTRIYQIVVEAVSGLLVLLFIYTAVSKLIGFEDFKRQMYNQTLPREVAALLIWTLPGSEILTAVMLIFRRTRKPGLYISAVLMLLFTGYISLVLLHYFSRIPCSCGGVIRALGWKMHLVFNVFFLLLSLLGIYFIDRERSVIGKE